MIVGHYVFFDKYFPDEFRNKIFRIEAVQKFNRRYNVGVLSPKAFKDVKLDDDVGLFPEQPNILYAINMTVIGEGIIWYLRYPTNTYFCSLDKSGFVAPDDPSTDGDKRYIGYYENGEEVELYTVKDMGVINVRVYNDSPDYMKAVLKCKIERCIISEVDKEIDIDDYLAKGLLTIIRHPKFIVGGV